MAENTLDRVVVLEDIRTLTTTATPKLDHVERTLADGYACALGIEATRSAAAASSRAALPSSREAGSGQVQEVAGLAKGIARTDGELAELRAALVELRETARVRPARTPS